MKDRLFLIAFAAVLAFGNANPAAAQDAEAGADKSILRVNVTSQRYNFMLPWQKAQPQSRLGLGALLQQNRVLVTAELVQDANYIELEVAATGKKLTAKVGAVDYEANLAIIQPAEDPQGFFDGMSPLELDTSAKVGDSLSVWQFESNGTPVSTDIELTRVEIGKYFLDDAYFLVYEASGSVQYRTGSFTLPVVRNGKLVGLLLSYSSSNQVADILAAPIIKHFLDDVAEPPYRGFPNFGIRYSDTLDEQLRSFLKIGDHEGGVLVSAVLPETSAGLAGLKEGDVILSVAGFSIDARGNYEHPDYGLLNLSHLVKGAVKVDDEIDVKIVREGEEQTVKVKLVRRAPTEVFVDPYMFDRGPKFFILGGLLLQELSVPYLELAGKDWRTRAPFRLLYARNHPEIFQKDGREKLIFLSGVLPSQSTLGYERLQSLIVSKINDKQINHIRDVDAAVKEPIDGVHKIEFTEFPYLIYVDAEQAESDNRQLLPNRYRISEIKRLD